MPEYLPLICNAETSQAPEGLFAPRKVFFALLAIIGAFSLALPQQLPPGGTTSWEIQGPEEIVTFVLFDPKTPVIRSRVAFLLALHISRFMIRLSREVHIVFEKKRSSESRPPNHVVACDSFE